MPNPKGRLHTTIIPKIKSQISAFLSSDFMPNLTVGLYTTQTCAAVPEKHADCLKCLSFVQEILQQGYDFSNETTTRNLMQSLGSDFYQAYSNTLPSALYNACRSAVRDCMVGCANAGICKCDKYTCTSDTNWVSASAGYMSKSTRSCGTTFQECGERTQYQCAAGYYGASTNGTSGCTKCPSPGISPAGTTAVTGCYIISWNDTTGAFDFGGDNCYYK